MSLGLFLGTASILAQLPPGWTDADIGSPGVAGSASYSAGNWTVIGGGGDIWNTADQFNFAYQSALTNWSVLLARVGSVQNTDPWTKAGVMFRDSTAADATFAMVVATPANGVNFQWRASQGGNCGYSQVAGINPPLWVKLVRAGTDFSGYYSTDGSAWTPIGPSQTIPMRDNAPGGLAVTAHNDALSAAATFNSVVVSNTAAPPPPPPIVFGVYRELWTGLIGSGSLDSLTNTANNPSWPNSPDAAYTKVLTNLETEVDFMDAYGQRVRTYVVPPTNGNYTFNIASDDNSELYLSTDETPAHMSLIAWVPGWTSSREWTKYPEQRSQPVNLEGGRRYYLEALMAEGGGGDNLAVRWQLPDGSFEEPLTAIGSAGTRLVPFNGIDALPGIYTQSPNQTVVEGQNARFSVLVTNRAAVAYQWTMNGGNISGATKPVYTVTNVTVAANNGQVYRCTVSNSAGSVAGAAINMSVIADTVRPTVDLAMSVGTTNVQILYSETVEAASATNTANYAFTNGLPVTRAIIGSDGISVMLTVGPMVYGSSYTVVINNVRDRASTPNTIASNTIARFTALPYSTQDIGNPPIGTSLSSVSNGLNVTASGIDIGGFSDQFGFAYSVRKGDFDVAARLAGLSLPDVWAKAGLMARETLVASSRFAAAFATPAMNGCFYEWRDPASANAGSSGGFPVNYPYTWLRLKRTGNTFTGYAGYDGQTWVQLGNSIISMPSQVYFGMAASSHNSAQAATAQFRDIIEVTNAVVAVVSNQHEPLGPSSRKTPIAFSEIMYKPAPRLDTNNLEFIEIYNSNPWFQDISGYRLAGNNLSYTFPAGTIIPGGGFLVVAASPQSLQNVYGLSSVLGPYTGSLKNPDSLQLLDEQGAVLLTVPFSNKSPWPVLTDGTGHSLVLAYPTYGEADPRAWDISDTVGGSPGQMDSFRPSPLRNVVINEFLAHTDPPDYDYIELYNHANQPVDISGCILTDDPTTNKFIIPQGTVIQPRGFVWFTETNLNFALNAVGEAIYLKNPDQSRYLDAVQFGGQENGVATGRWPDGANDWYRLAAKTPGTNNAAIRISDVVINEVMYHPISGDDDDQFIELYNRGTNVVNLGGWQLADAVSYTFASNIVLAVDGYLVIARNAAHLRSNYANLNLNNCVGNFTGKLSHNGEHLALTMPDTTVQTNSLGVVSTNLMHIAVNDVTYEAGGRWGQWSGGGGSSLELRDPASNNRLAANWADSDETQKSSWVNIESTGVLDNGANYDASIDYAQIGLLDVGECLVDNIQVMAGTAGPNLVANPDFESGTLANWSLQGCMSRSTLEPGGYASSAYSLRVRASSRLFTGDNSCQMDLNANSLSEGQTATLRFKARWLRGWPEALLRLNGNWLEAAGRLPVPANLGTPGARNSQYINNAGPAIYAVTHSPAVPAAFQNAVVSMRVHDSSGVTNLTLNYRLDPSTSYISVPLKDDGTGGDAIARDGIFSATIPGQAANVIVAFYVSAADSRGANSRFPALVNDNAPVREGLVMFGDGNPAGSFGVYHLWISQINAQRWADLADLSNESHDCTMVSGSRVIYNIQARWAGSPYHQGFDTPYGNPCHYKWTFPDDEKFLGATSFNKIHQPGNGAGDDASLQREQLANSFLRALGVPWLNRRYVAVYVNGSRRGTLMEDTQTPDADVVEEHFPNDANGWLYKMQPWFEFGPYPQGIEIPFANQSWCTIMPYTTTGGAKKTARYRYMYLMRKTPTSANDFSNVFSVVDAASTYGSPGYAANMEKVADMENWMRVFAANHAAGNWDAYGCQNAQNLYGYIGTQGTKYSLLMFDFNIVIGNSGSWGPGQNLFSVNGQDPNTQNIYYEPTFRRMYWRALQELVNGPLDLARSGPLLDAKYAAFTANGLNVENPNSSIKAWVSQAHDSIASQIAGENAAIFAVNSAVLVSNDVAYVTGTAPVSVRTITINGGEYPLTWTSVTGFRLAVPLRPGTNQLSIVGLDMHDLPITGASNFVSAVYNGTLPSPVGKIVINEIMYNPVNAGAEYIELFNNSSTLAFDLSGYALKGLAYTFPPGSIIGPTNYLILAANSPAFAKTYGVAVPVFDTFSGTLQTDGETLKLIQPGTNATDDFLVAGVKYENNLPWSTNALTPGTSLQLIDPAQDNSRVGNWGVGQSSVAAALRTPGAVNSIRTTLPAFPSLWINELQPENLTGPTNSAGQRTAWIELFNPGSNSVSLSGLYLANSYTNLAQWSFPAGAVLNPGQFKVVFTDGQTGLSTTSEPHTSFTLPPGAGSLALSRIYNGQPQVLDYLNYTNLAANHSYGSFPDGQNLQRSEFYFATAGASNNVASPPLSVVINEWMAGNTNTIPDPVTGKYGDWFELYNYGTNPANLAGFYLTDTTTNTFNFQIPSGYVIPSHSFLLVWADNKSTSGTPDLHVTFKLSKNGSAIGLFGADGKVVDFVTFGPQVDDISQGRFPDGSANIFSFTRATPGAANIGPNSPPVLNRPADQYLYPGQSLSFALQASDPEAPPQILTFTLGAGAPPGASVSPAGLFSWTSAPAQGNSTNLITAIVADNGIPALSDSKTFTVVVYPQNTPPVLGQIPAQTVAANKLLTFSISATDTDQPPQSLTFTLQAGAPAGASISPAGVFAWTPALSQAPSTNSLFVTVTDSGIPQLSATNGFTVIVQGTNSTSTPILQSAIAATGPFADESSATIDTNLQTVRTPLPSSTRFYRLRSSTTLRILSLRAEAGELVLTYQ